MIIARTAAALIAYAVQSRNNGQQESLETCRIYCGHALTICSQAYQVLYTSGTSIIMTGAGQGAATYCKKYSAPISGSWTHSIERIYP